MKAFRVILKIVAALAAIAGIVYIVATYGDKITAWAKNLLNRYCCCCDCDCDCGCDCDCDCQCEEAAEELAADSEPSAAENDFE